MATYGVTLPSRYSPRVSGVTIICSSVPRARSRTTAWLMIDMTEIMRIVAMSPGIIALTALSDGLNTTRTSEASAGPPVRTPSAARRRALYSAITCAA